MEQFEKPLSQAELGQLDAFLESDIAPESCLSLDELHGYLTAIVCAVNVVLPSRWLPHVWQDEEGPAFESDEQARAILALMMRLNNEISRALMRGDFQPLYAETVDAEGKVSVAPGGWCWGFRQGMKLDPEGWMPHLKALEEPLAPIVMLSEVNAGSLSDELQAAVSDRATVLQLADMIPEQTRIIHQYLLGHQFEPSGDSSRHPVPRVGRNDPCPCGSGKKYKQCCGAPRLH